jgi:hypothetical protein
MATKFYWYSVRMVTIDGESYSDSVSRGKHPFQIQRDEQDSTGNIVTLLSWKEISKSEYDMHGEAV